MTSLWWLRWLMVVIGSLIGAVLILSHHVIIGVLILAMAMARASVLVTVRKRRAALRAGRAGRFGPPGTSGTPRRRRRRVGASAQSLRPVRASLTPTAIMANPPMPPISSTRLGDFANHSLTAPANKPQALSQSRAMTENTKPSTRI